MRNVLITGSDGFIGKNLKAHLLECENINPICFTKKNSIDELYKNILSCETIIHLAAVNKSKEGTDFFSTNFKLTKLICDFIKKNQLTKNLIFFSSIHDSKNTKYGKSKKLGIDYLQKFSKKNNISIYILRLPRVFGKWSRPNYNSAIATFCEALENNRSVKIYNPNKKLELSYIDDTIQYIIDYINLKKKKTFFNKRYS
jgi:UDP-2-acetamido-2,6-beta-L-arabino-hexul-4-ose reductase